MPADQRTGRPTADELIELMSVLAHDLRTPLTPVKGYAEILRSRRDLGAEKTMQYAGIVVEAATRMERSVDMLSGISALYAGRGQVRNEPVAAADIVAERLDVWRGRQPERAFAGDTEAAPGAVLVDRGWIGKALDVLIEAALRGSPAPAVISLRAITGRYGAAEAAHTRFVVGAPPGGDGADGDGADSGAADSGAADRPAAAAPDRLSSAFVAAVCAVCGYRLIGDFELEVPVAAAA
ncbi:MAG: hypothetical protein QOG49_25 [Frankiaceae bacterium]|nr:hypothetical protein [Frankiaceae bacterium]